MNGIRLGSVFGFEIRIDYSWFVIFFLLLWSFTVGVFPVNFPGLSTGTYVGMGLAGTLLFFASLLGHELSHSAVARSKGIPVEGITLFIFGGMAHTKMEFEKPADEFMIAGVGPLSSLLIGAGFGTLWWVGVQSGWPVAVVGVAQYLAWINVILALFNLLPGFPLDGGRLFRAAVWKFTGDLTRATRAASLGGKLLGYLLMLLGFLQVFGGNLIGGLWLVFIGWFVRGAAETSYSQHLLRSSMEGVRAGDVMTPDPQTVAPDTTLQQFVDEFIVRGRHTSYPVVDDQGHPLGLISLEQVKKTQREDWPARSIGEAMTPLDDSLVATPEDSMSDVLDRLGGAKTQRVLVTRDGALVGIITARDLTRWLQAAHLRGS